MFNLAAFEKADLTTGFTFVGALVIITACLVVAFESRFRARNAAHLPASDILE